MMFAELSPKTITPEGDEGELVFCSSEEGMRDFMNRRPAGKLLIVTDGSALRAFRTCLPPRALCLVLDSDDCLPLFSCSDDVASIVAAGRESTLVLARYFAEIRKIPCALFPVSAALGGAFECDGRVRLSSVSTRVPLAEATVYCDQALLAPSLGQAYMRLLLARLALIEAKALRGFGLDGGSEGAYEQAFQALLPLQSKTLALQDVVTKNAVIRKCERGGMIRGEGICLANEIGRYGEEQAFFLLAALYSAFFAKGKPRLIVPDYAARARAAGAAYALQRVPTLQELVYRGISLERMRAELCWELSRFLEGETHFKANFYALTGRAVAPLGSAAALKYLPEQTAGLSAIIRDFGLMEWEEQDIFAKSV